MNRRRFLAAGVAVGATLVAGCIRGPGAGAETADGGTTSAREAYPDYEWGLLDGVAPYPATDVEMRGGRFRPPVTAMRPGAGMPFVNRDDTPHTVTIPALGVDERLGAGDRHVVTTDRTGSYGYVSTARPPGMVGRLIVTDAISELQHYNP